MDMQTAQAEIAAAAGDASKISADALKFVAEYKAPATDGLLTQDKANALAASARKKAEAELAKQQERIAELEDALSQKSGKPDIEKQLERLERKLAEAQKAADERAAELVATKRAGALKDISSKVDWHDGVSVEAREAILNAFTSKLDIDDLFDEATVNPLIAGIREKNPNLVAAASPAGTGGKPGANASSGVQEISLSALNDLVRTDPAKAQKLREMAWTGVASGKVKLVA